MQATFARRALRAVVAGLLGAAVLASAAAAFGSRAESSTRSYGLAASPETTV